MLYKCNLCKHATAPSMAYSMHGAMCMSSMICVHPHLIGAANSVFRSSSKLSLLRSSPGPRPMSPDPLTLMLYRSSLCRHVTTHSMAMFYTFFFNYPSVCLNLFGCRVVIIGNYILLRILSTFTGRHYIWLRKYVWLFEPNQVVT